MLLRWLVPLVGLLLLCCDGSSPSAPQMGTIPGTIVYSNPTALEAFEADITSLLEQTLQQSDAALGLGFIQITVSPDAARTIPDWGIGGYTLGPNDVEIVIDPNYPGLEQILPLRLPHIAAHEFHHAVRWRGPGPYATLLEALVFEGMADHFASEVVGSGLQPWSRAFPEGQTDLYLSRAEPEFDTLFDFNAWFLGIGTDLPVWTGYTLGYRMVRDYIAANPGASGSSLVNPPADAFRPE